jgi:hypothetical protein
MSEAFDPYRKWLGIPPKDQPANHYRLLGIANFEDDPDVIENAASRQMAHVRTFQSGRHSAISQRILNELTTAKLCLLQTERKVAYDAHLRAQLAAAGKLSSEEPLEVELDDEGEGQGSTPPVINVSGSPSANDRWRTGAERPGGERRASSAEIRPVPIPMPAPVVVGPKARKAANPTARPPKGSKLLLPILLIAGSLVLVLAGGALVWMQSGLGTTEAKTANKSTKTTSEKHGKAAHQSATKSSSSGNRATDEVATDFTSPRKGSSGDMPLVPEASQTEETPKSDPKAELFLARQALQLRDESKYQFHVNQAEYLYNAEPDKKSPELETEAAHLRSVHKRLSQFWQLVRDGVDKKIPAGERFKFRKHELELVSREGEQVTYKLDGQEATTPLRKLPARVATMIGYRALSAADLADKQALALFLVVDADAASDPSSHRLASRLLADLAKAGAESDATLDRELGKLPQTIEAGDDLSPPLVVQAAPGGVTPTEPNAELKPPKPMAVDRENLKLARDKFNSTYREQLLQASENPERVKPLMNALASAVATAETNEYKTLLLSQAAELAAQLGDSASIVKWSEQIGQLSNEKPLEFQVRLLGRTRCEGLEPSRELAKVCLASADQAQQQGNEYLATEFVKIARRVAEKYPTELDLPMLMARQQELEKARAERN